MDASQPTLPPKWWQTTAALGRPYLKTRGKTLRDLTCKLNDYQALGIDALEVFAPCKGGVNYHGLDTLDYYTIDPEIGTRDDFQELVEAAHERGIAVILFLNLGYGHQDFPAFLKACDAIRSGIDRAEARYFLWSETGKDTMDRSLTPYFMNDSHGEWRWSERAQRYFWVKWFGDDGQSELPQFNFGDPGWQEETRRILDFWMQTGVDGMVVDAVNWYIHCNWAICRYTMTNVIHRYPNTFSQPEGAGGFKDDPVLWIREGGFNCVMDYAIQTWWENLDVIGDAIRAGNPSQVEAALQSYRDRVAAAGGVCYINPPEINDLPRPAQVLGTAVVATAGELLILIGEQLENFCEYPQDEIIKLLEARRKYPALCAGGSRLRIPTQDDGRFYAFLRTLEGAASMLVVMNFQPDPATVVFDLSKQGFQGGQSIFTADGIELGSGSTQVHLPAYGYSIFELSDL